jgi:hypothetical protein
MEDHMNRMVSNGWEIIGQVGLGGHVRLGRTIAMAEMTAGLSLLAGGSRTANQIVVTYRRTQMLLPAPAPIRPIPEGLISVVSPLGEALNLLPHPTAQQIETGRKYDIRECSPLEFHLTSKVAKDLRTKMRISS